jgi:hypothetical protein
MQIRKQHSNIYLVEIHTDCADKKTFDLNTLQMLAILNIPEVLRRLVWQIARCCGFLMLYDLNFITYNTVTNLDVTP